MKVLIPKMPADKGSRVKLIVTIILSIVFILVWINTIKIIGKRFGWGKKPVAHSNSPRSKIVNQEATKVQEVPIQVIDLDDGMEWTRCPFCGTLYVGGVSGVVALSGILWDDENPKAVINGEIVGVGGNVNRYSVINISRNSVTLNDGIKDIEISLEE